MLAEQIAGENTSKAVLTALRGAGVPAASVGHAEGHAADSIDVHGT